MASKRKLKLSAIIVCVSALLVVLLLCAVDFVVSDYSEGRVFDDVEDVKPTEVGLLLGTTPQTRVGGKKSYFFEYRIKATEELYKAGKIHKILISGDENSLDGVNEPICMKDSLVAHGIPKETIILDGKGFRTLDSVVRTRKTFGIRTFTIISQRFHNERALYLAEHLGLDVEGLQGYNAKDPSSAMSLMTYIREHFARVKMLIDILTDKQPKTMEGKKSSEQLRLQETH